MDIAYYPGCSLKQSSGLYDAQTKRIFSLLGVNLREIDDWNCCGATSAGKTDDFMAIAMPARNIGLAESAGFSEMVIPCSACYSRTMVAKEKMANDPALRDEINGGLSKKVNGTLRILSILELLLTKVEDKTFKEKVVKKYEGLSPVCYYGCMLTRFPCDMTIPDDAENPQGMEKVLKQLGLNTLDWNYKTFCCGASAAMNDKETSLNLMAKIMKDAIARGGNCFVVTCPMCQMNLDICQDDLEKTHGIKERLPVFFITELVGLVMGLSIQDLQIERHFTESVSILKEHRINE